MIRPDAVNSILIVRPSAMGDVVMASPLLTGLRARFPAARISWLIDPGLSDLLRHHPDVDRLIPWSKKEWGELLKRGRLLSLLRRVGELRRDLHAEGFDLCLDLQGLLRSRLLSRLSGAKRRLGFTSKEPGEWLLHEVVPKGGDNDLIGSEYLYLGEFLGADRASFRFALEPGGEAVGWWRTRREQEGFSGNYAVLAPFTTRPQKHWVEARWTELARAISTDLGLPCCLLGGPGDRIAAARMLAAGAPVANLVGEATLARSMAVVADAALVIGVDTGLTHLGSAFSRPTVGLFGSTCPYRTTGRATTEILYHRLACSPCRRSPTCEGRFDCMAALRVDEVVAAARRVRGAGDR